MTLEDDVLKVALAQAEKRAAPKQKVDLLSVRGADQHEERMRALEEEAKQRELLREKRFNEMNLQTAGTKEIEEDSEPDAKHGLFWARFLLSLDFDEAHRFILVKSFLDLYIKKPELFRELFKELFNAPRT